MPTFERRVVDQLIEVSGLKAACQGEGDLIEPLVSLSWLSQGLPLPDKARIYAAAVDLMEEHELAIPAVTDDLFFDQVTMEIGYGQIQQRQRSEIRATRQALDERIEIGVSGLEARTQGDTAGADRGRVRPVEGVPNRDPDEGHEEAFPDVGF